MAPRGRPPLDPDHRTSAVVNVRMTVRDFDRLCHRARREQISLAEVVRRAVRRDLARNAPGAPRNDES